MHVKREIRQRVGAALLLSAVLTVGVVLGQPASASAMYIDDGPNLGPIGSGLLYQQCPTGYACVWEGEVAIGNPPPEHRYYNYGSYRFTNEYGWHTIWNHQTGGAKVQLCLGTNGTNCTVTIPAGKFFHGSLTPFNSIKLIP